MKSKKIIYNTLTKFILVLVIIQTPLIYYYTSGLAFFFLVLLIIIIEIIIFIWLFASIIVDDAGITTKFHKRGLLIAVLIFLFSVIYSEKVIEYLDWHLRRNSREEIIELIKNNKLKSHFKYSNGIIKLDRWNFPPISNGGNEISLSYNDKNEITVLFFINRGFLDHYSAFVYSNNPLELKHLNEHINFKKSDKSLNYKIDNNWFRVSY